MKRSIFTTFVLLFFLAFPVLSENITVGPSDFVDASGEANTYVLGNRGEYLYKSKNTNYLYAAVHLPDQVMIKAVRLICFFT